MSIHALIPRNPPAQACRPTALAACLALIAPAAGLVVLIAALLAPAAAAGAERETLRQNPLQLAAAEGNDKEVRRLLARGAEINAPGARGATALGWAARNDHEETVRILLDAGANPDAASAPDRSALALAASRGNVGVVRLLLERGSKLAQRPELAAAVVRATSEARSVEIAELVVPRLASLFAASPGLRAQLAITLVTAPDAAVARAIVRLLAPASETPEYETQLLHAAVHLGRPRAVSSAIARGADVNDMHSKRGSPLSEAIRRRDRDITVLLLSAGAVWSALDANQTDVLREIAGDVIYERRAGELLASIGAMNARDSDGQTLLFRAAGRGDEAAVSQLLSMKADPAATVRRWPGDEGWTALMIAAAGGHEGVVRKLLGAGAPVDQRNARGRTALALAAFYGRSGAVALLLDAGADPDAADHLGQTPRILAVASGDGRSMELLAGRSRPQARASGQQ